jgi:hypothetical protein
MKELQTRKENQDDSTKRMPNLRPGAITGTYYEFDEALIQLQNPGLTRTVGPFFLEVEITIDADRAERILEKFTPEERTLLSDLSQSFIPEAA